MLYQYPNIESDPDFLKNRNFSGPTKSLKDIEVDLNFNYIDLITKIYTHYSEGRDLSEVDEVKVSLQKLCQELGVEFSDRELTSKLKEIQKRLDAVDPDIRVASEVVDITHIAKILQVSLSNDFVNSISANFNTYYARLKSSSSMIFAKKIHDRFTQDESIEVEFKDFHLRFSNASTKVGSGLSQFPSLKLFKQAFDQGSILASLREPLEDLLHLVAILDKYELDRQAQDIIKASKDLNKTYIAIAHTLQYILVNSHENVNRQNSFWNMGCPFRDQFVELCAIGAFYNLRSLDLLLKELPLGHRKK